MLESLIIDLLKHGTLAGITLGATCEEVEAKYGPPAMGRYVWRPENYPNETWEWWKYGDLDVHFRCGRLWSLVIYFWGNAPSFSGERFKNWKIREDLLEFEPFMAFVGEQGITLRVSTAPTFEHEIRLEGPCGTGFGFIDDKLSDIRLETIPLTQVRRK